MGVEARPAAAMYDVIIIGGGPAGLSAALILGRCRRRVLLCDSGEYRNLAAREMHGFLSRDPIEPAELRAIARQQLARYGVEVRQVKATACCRSGSAFEVALEGGQRLCARRLLLATGVVDHLPEIEGAREFYGSGLFHCPYCDGWEVRDQPLAVYGRGASGAGLALSLQTWSRDVVLATDGPAGLKRRESERLARHAIPVRQERVARFEGNGRLERIVFATGESLARSSVFFSTGQHQRSELLASLGVAFTRKGTVATGRLEECNVPGVYVAGDASRDVQLAIVAAAEGAKAGFAINKALEREDRE
ncbi:MAG TPA: NAD(P)/FAD-dependent oxidoreductase [Bryobacteraceae bacterium]|nr:NAD(P)/FAD-dependent oxidoreductase [Bryobacteraceae bacterium]